VALALAWVAVTVTAAEIPSGVEMPVRLETKVSSRDSKAGDPVRAVVIAPVLAGERIVIPSGTKITGVVTAAKSSKADDRAELQIRFKEMIGTSGKKATIQAKVTDVDNAREEVDKSGKVLGIIPSQTLSGRIDQGIGKVGKGNSELAEMLGMAKSAIFKAVNPEIEYEAGIEMTVQLQTPVRFDEPVNEPKLSPVADDAGLYRLVNEQPFQTYAEQPYKPSDITNLMFVGTEQQLVDAFKDAGWSEAHALNSESVMETIRAVAELRGYKEAPMSTLLLNRRRADFNFQKSNNTFAQRHHLRIWRMPVTYMDRPVWVASSTHDIGISFSEENQTFIHTIDPNIDKERAKIVADLLFTGRVTSLALVERPKVPKATMNATGDEILTDARMAVVVFK
jgi:hypothetical protein